MVAVPVHVVGVALSAVAAVFTAGQILLVRVGSERAGITDAVLLSMLVNVGVFLPIALVLEFPDYGITRVSLVSFVAAGLVGTMLGRLLYYGSVKRIGATRTEPIKASMPLWATLIAVVALGERLTVVHGIGIALISLGVAAISWETSQSEAEEVKDVSAMAIGLPLLAAFAFAAEPVLARVGFAEGTPLFVALVLKTGAAALGFVAYLRWKDALPGRRLVVGESANVYILAGLCNTVAVLTYYAALEISRVVVVAPITQTSPLLVALIAYLLLRHLERVTLKLVAASCLVVLGAVFVTVFA